MDHLLQSMRQWIDQRLTEPVFPDIGFRWVYKNKYEFEILAHPASPASSYLLKYRGNRPLTGWGQWNEAYMDKIEVKSYYEDR